MASRRRGQLVGGLRTAVGQRPVQAQSVADHDSCGVHGGGLVGGEPVHERL
ncbi:MAG TPA: hypothetical protein VMM13_08165 [Euzebya sp.]|nr:hypothetical protein [Euzebya sp.]